MLRRINKNPIKEETKTTQETNQNVRAEMPLPKEKPSEEQTMFADWLNGFVQQFQYIATPSEVANMSTYNKEHLNLILLTGIAHNTGQTIEELKKLNDNLRVLAEALGELVDSIEQDGN